jgi:hypothetical protein
MVTKVFSIFKVIFNFIKIFFDKNQDKIMELLWEFLMLIVKDARDKKKAEQEQKQQEQQQTT